MDVCRLFSRGSAVRDIWKISSSAGGASERRKASTMLCAGAPYTARWKCATSPSALATIWHFAKLRRSMEAEAVPSAAVAAAAIGGSMSGLPSSMKVRSVR